jgi:hypothetical protein
MGRLFRIIYIVVLVAISFPVISQGKFHGPRPFVLSGDIFGTRNFIENKGQFHSPRGATDSVLYMFICSPTVANAFTSPGPG